MIDAELRRAVLANFPPGTPLVVIAPEAAGYPALLESRGDAAAGWLPLETDGRFAESPALAGIPHVLVEGLDDVEDPAGLLGAIRTTATAARLFVLVANAAYLKALLAFFGGRQLAAGHPLVREELEPLLGSAGWRLLAINPVPDESIPSVESLPVDLMSPAICFKIKDAAMLERSRVRAFVAIADPA